MKRIPKYRERQIGKMGCELYYYSLEHNPHMIFELRRKRKLWKTLKTEGKKIQEEIDRYASMPDLAKEAKDLAFMFFDPLVEKKNNTQFEKEEAFAKKLIGKTVKNEMFSKEGTITCYIESKYGKYIVVNYGDESQRLEYPSGCEWISTNDSEIKEDIQKQIIAREAGWKRFYSYGYYNLTIIKEWYKKLKAKYKKSFSTPFWVYLVLICLISLALVFSFYAKESLSELLRNTSYSLIASFLAAVLIDHANRKNVYSQDLYAFSCLTQNLFSSCVSLFDTIYNAYVRRYGERQYSIFRLSTSDVFYMIFRPHSSHDSLSIEDYDQNIESVINSINQIREEANKLKEQTPLFVNNENLDYMFRLNLDHLIRDLGALQRMHRNGELIGYSHFEFYLNSIYYLFPGLEHFFIEEYHFSRSLPFYRDESF